MAFRTLRSFVSFLEEKGDLVRVRAEVDPHLEMTEIATRVVKRKGPAILFERPKGSSVPVLVNALGAERRIAWMLGRSPADVGRDIGRLADTFMPPSLPALWNERRALGRVLAMKPKRVGSPAVLTHRIEPANLDFLPVAQSWPKDGGPFLTFPLVLTKSPVDGRQNMGVYRMQKYGPTETGMHWQIGKGGGYHYLQAEERGRPLPLIAALGADPILMMCGVLPLPEGLDEMAFAGFLRGEATRAGVARASGLTFPAEADFLLEGAVAPAERRVEGPYGDHFGHYSHAAPFPVFRIDRIWHRPDPIFPIAVVGRPPQEDQVIGDAVQEILLPLLKIMHPEVVDLWAYQEAGFHNLLVAGIRQRFAKEGVKTALWALGEGQLALTKCVVLVDPDVNARDFRAVLRAIRRHFDPANDFILLPGTSQDTLDFTGAKMNLGSKMVIDATAGGAPPRSDAVALDLGRLSRLDGRIRGARLLDNALLALQVESGGREILEKMINFPGLDGVSLVAAVSLDVPLDDPELLIWGVFTRFDCARDTFFRSAELRRGHPVYGGSLFIDATWKPGYPEPLEMTDVVIRRVDRRWGDYGLGLDPGRHSVSHPGMTGMAEAATKETSHSH